MARLRRANPSDPADQHVERGHDLMPVGRERCHLAAQHRARHAGQFRRDEDELSPVELDHRRQARERTQHGIVRVNERNEDATGEIVEKVGL